SHRSNARNEITRAGTLAAIRPGRHAVVAGVDRSTSRCVVVRHHVFGTLVAFGAASAVLLGQGQATFRGGTDLVTVDVAVRQRNVPVTGLTSADFIVTDNGVRQTVEAVSLESMPANVSLMLDTSGSVETFLDQMKTQVRE